MTVALARKKGFVVNEAQAKKELGFAVATDEPVLEPKRLGLADRRRVGHARLYPHGHGGGRLLRPMR